MEHIYIDGKSPVLILFHGTGGNEKSLLSVARELSPSSAILGIRGNVSENGMNRYFRRLSEGVFDEEDLRFRSEEIYQFLLEASRKYFFDLEDAIAVGYSNGANIIGSLLYLKGKVFSAAILHHPMVPLRNEKLKDLTGLNVFIGEGKNDPITPMSEAEDLEKHLREANASVYVHWENKGHQLTLSEVEAAREWLLKKV